MQIQIINEKCSKAIFNFRLQPLEFVATVVSLIFIINCYVCQQRFILSLQMTTGHGEIKSNVNHKIALFNSNAN